MAADVLVDLALNAQNEDTRRRAAEAVLDRAGIRSGMEIDVSARAAGGPSPAEVLRERLSTLGRRLAASELPHELEPGLALDTEDDAGELAKRKLNDRDDQP